MTGKRYRFSASMTVEAAFVVPSVLFCYIFVIYAGFYLHDSITAESAAFMLSEHLIKSCFKNINLEEKQVDYSREWDSILTEQWDDNLGEQEDIIMSEGRAFIQEKMLMSSISEMNIECSRNSFGESVSCSIEVSGNMRLPIKIFNIETAAFCSRGSTQMTDAVKYLWKN